MTKFPLVLKKGERVMFDSTSWEVIGGKSGNNATAKLRRLTDAKHIIEIKLADFTETRVLQRMRGEVKVISLPTPPKVQKKKAFEKILKGITVEIVNGTTLCLLDKSGNLIQPEQILRDHDEWVDVCWSVDVDGMGIDLNFWLKDESNHREEFKCTAYATYVDGSGFRTTDTSTYKQMRVKRVRR